MQLFFLECTYLFHLNLKRDSIYVGTLPDSLIYICISSVVVLGNGRCFKTHALLSLFRNSYLSFVFNNIESLLIWMLCTKFDFFGPVVLEKKSKMWKVYRWPPDNRQSEKLLWTFSSGELKMWNVQVSILLFFGDSEYSSILSTLTIVFD